MGPLSWLALVLCPWTCCAGYMVPNPSQWTLTPSIQPSPALAVTAQLETGVCTVGCAGRGVDTKWTRCYVAISNNPAALAVERVGFQLLAGRVVAR